MSDVMRDRMGAIFRKKQIYTTKNHPPSSPYFSPSDLPSPLHDIMRGRISLIRPPLRLPSLGLAKTEHMRIPSQRVYGVSRSVSRKAVLSRSLFRARPSHSVCHNPPSAYPENALHEPLFLLFLPFFGLRQNPGTAILFFRLSAPCKPSSLELSSDRNRGFADRARTAANAQLRLALSRLALGSQPEPRKTGARAFARFWDCIPRCLRTSPAFFCQTESKPIGGFATPFLFLLPVSQHFLLPFQNFFAFLLFSAKQTVEFPQIWHGKTRPKFCLRRVLFKL